MFQLLIGPSRVGRTIGTRTSTRRPSAHHAKRDSAADADIRDQPAEHRHVADLRQVESTCVKAEGRTSDLKPRDSSIEPSERPNARVGHLTEGT
jgi:hypothetical protein